MSDKNIASAMRVLVIITAAVFGFFNCIHNNQDVRGLPKNDRLVLIGDSIFALSGVEKQEIAKLARENSRGYARSGDTLDGISRQYDRAKRDGAIRSIIMDGGGNNVLIGGQSACTANSPSELQQACLDILQTAWDKGAALLARMHQDGVQDVMWQGYYALKRSKLGLNSALEVGVAGLRDMCEDAAVNCHFVDVRSAFAGRPDYIKSDDIHPTDPGSKVLAQEMWNAMRDFGVEQNQ